MAGGWRGWLEAWWLEGVVAGGWVEGVGGWQGGGGGWLEGGFTVRCGTVSLLHGSVRYSKLPARFGAVR